MYTYEQKSLKVFISCFWHYRDSKEKDNYKYHSDKGGVLQRIEEILEKEHRGIERLLDQILESNNGEEKKRIFSKVSDELLKHLEGEEKVYYPALNEDVKNVERSELNESEQEHHIAKILIRELKNLKVTCPDWDAKIEVLKENLEHHHEEEEEDFFEESRKVLSEKKSGHLGKRFRECKNNN